MLLLDGRLVSKHQLNSLKPRIERFKTTENKVPGLAVIRVGEDEASKIYVGHKIKKCAELGIISKEIHLPEKTSQEQVLDQIDELNNKAEIHGILIQLPLPKHLNQTAIIDRISPEKDVDGFHPMNLGKLLSKQKSFVACTPRGIMTLLHHYKIEVAGKRAVVVGRSITVGRPMSLLLDQADATVTVVHLGTKDPCSVTREADILIVATGCRHLVGEKDVKNGAVVIDVGIHRKEDAKICGDVNFEEVKNKVSAITPVPGGVGPMTICSLMENTFDAFLQIEKLSY